MTYEDLYADQEGLNGFSFKKIRLKDVSLKNAVKVAKVAVPIATSFIPAVGGIGSGLLSKALTNKNGTSNLVGRVANSVSKVSKTQVGQLVTNQAKKVINPNKPAPVQAVNQLTPASFATDTYQTQQVTESETFQPVGELTPVKEVSTAKTSITTVVGEKKNNTLLWVVGAVVVGGGIYLATKKD